MKIKKEEYEWCIALENVGVYDNSTFGSVPLFLKGELATKEKVFSYIPDMTEKKYSKLFRPATEEEINGESDYKRKLINDLPTGNCYCPTQSSLDFEIEQKWRDLRNQAAIAAMQGLILMHRHDSYETIARMAVEQADALIAELRKEK